MELQVPYSVCAEIPKEGVFRRKTPGDKRNIEAVMSVEGSRDNRRRSMPRPYTYAGKHPAQNERFGIYGIFERKSALLIFQKYGNMKFAYRNREFWCKGYYVDTVGKNAKAIKTYIGEQLKRDKESDQISMFDPRDPFMGSK